MATPRVLELLMSAGDFARTSATDQRNRLVTYYQDWFTSNYKINCIDNIRATQRLTTHSRAMGLAVGVVLMALLEEASGLSVAQLSSRGLLNVEVGPATHQEEEPTEIIPVEDVHMGTPEPAQESPPEPMTTTTPPPAQWRRPSRSKGPPRAQ